MTDQMKFSYTPATWSAQKPDMSATTFHPAIYSVIPPEMRSHWSQEQQSKISLLEAAHFFSANVAGEKYVIETAELTDEKLFAAYGLREYRERLIREEKDHTKSFRFYLQSVGLEDPSAFNLFGQSKPLHDVAGIADYATKIIMFEYISEQVSAGAMQDEQLEPVTRSLHKYHWDDERNHVGAGARAIPELLKILPVSDQQAILQKALVWSQILKRAFFPDGLAAKANFDQPDKIRQQSFEYYDTHPHWAKVFRQVELFISKIFEHVGKTA